MRESARKGEKRGSRHSEMEEGRFVSGWVWDQGVITHQTMPAGPGTLLSRGLGGTKKMTQSLALEGQSLVGDKP